MKQNDKTLLIDRYITGKLEDTELWEFKTSIDKDASLAREVKLRKEIYDTISNDKKMALLKTLNKISAQKKTRFFHINVHSRQIQAFAASVIVLMIIGAGLLSNYVGNSNGSNYDVYNEYFVDEGSLLSTRSDVDPGNSLVETGVMLYSDGKYKEAISMLNSNPENVVARLYSGFTYMKLEQFDMAEQQFEYIINHNDNIFIDQAEWNLGLSYLANNKTEQADKLFTKISSGNGAYSTQATNIRKELENK
ncbi:MAG: hypothetical protein QM503_08730 [Bacteroidota bacterium]